MNNSIRACKKYVAVAVAAIFLSSLASATTETGNVVVRAFSSTTVGFADKVVVKLESPSSPTSCTASGLVFLPTGDGNKAMYAMLLAANMAGKPVTIDFNRDASGNCALLDVVVN
jgi:hypothetical protein